jgi:hypothetical protein
LGLGRDGSVGVLVEVSFKSKSSSTPMTTPISNIGEKEGKTLLQQFPYSLP